MGLGVTQTPDVLCFPVKGEAGAWGAAVRWVDIKCTGQGIAVEAAGVAITTWHDC